MPFTKKYSSVCLCSFLTILALHSPANAVVAPASTSIQMLPPMQNTSVASPCFENDNSGNAEGNKVLTWDGATSIKCSKNITVDPAGKLGIGVASPSHLLTVNKQDGVWGAPAAGGTAQPASALRLYQGSLATDFGMHGSGTFWMQNSLTSNLGSYYPISLNPNGGNVGIGKISPTAKLDVSGDAAVSGNTVVSGTMGVGTAAPAAKLDVVGGVKVGADNTCDASKGGTLRYNSGTKKMQYCNESAWTDVGGGGAPDCQVYHADTNGVISGGTRVIYSNEMVLYTCPADRPKLLSGSCWRKNWGTFIGTHNMEDGQSYLCRIEGSNGLDIWATCCK